jgi:SAM-dependent methyltransferase
VAVTGALDRLMEHPVVYSVWQAPFAARKFAPVERWLRGHDIRRVLDVGCGAGTNAERFINVEYVGIDVNERYLQAARARFPGQFIQADLTRIDLSTLGTFDMILANSFFHHVIDSDVERILAQLKLLLTPEGTIHILDLVQPDRQSLARMMARLDRGRYARPIERWRALFGAAFEPIVVEPYFLGGKLWSMVYFQGRRKS